MQGIENSILNAENAEEGIRNNFFSALSAISALRSCF